VSPQIFPRLARDIEATIFRVVQESLTNVYRHSGSKTARIEIDKQPEWIIVRVRDYGKGISPEIAGRFQSGRIGIGIGGMRERVRQFGGELRLSRAEPGTLVEARVPVLGVAPEQRDAHDGIGKNRVNNLLT
jgi:two-component system NarL family sensor kinase